jgi:hypothetical protein
MGELFVSMVPLRPLVKYRDKVPKKALFENVRRDTDRLFAAQ